MNVNACFVNQVCLEPWMWMRPHVHSKTTNSVSAAPRPMSTCIAASSMAYEYTRMRAHGQSVCSPQVVQKMLELLQIRLTCTCARWDGAYRVLQTHGYLRVTEHVFERMLVARRAVARDELAFVFHEHAQALPPGLVVHCENGFVFVYLRVYIIGFRV